jgi:hydroxymethylpyrimidine/phosphomethylpyrimidine kinase
MTTSHAFTRVLSVAGSDSGGGAGIQADLKAFARCGVHGTCAVTVVTAQSTRGVELIHAIPPEVVVAQIEAVVGDIGVDAVKIGMLGGRETVIAVAEVLGRVAVGVPIVVDPVLVASTGARLLEIGALDAFGELIMPLATVLTPNLPEARRLVHQLGISAGWSGGGGETDGDLARELQRLGAAHVVLTGGHRAVTTDHPGDGELAGGEVVTDLYWDGATLVEIPGERYPDGATHGSGCTHSAVLAAELGLGRSVLEAARTARARTGEAIKWGLAGIGGGAGPVDVLGRTGKTPPGRVDRLP